MPGLDLYALGTTGLLDYVRGVSPYYPKPALGPGAPTRYWRMRQALVVAESRGISRSKFIDAAGGCS